MEYIKKEELVEGEIYKISFNSLEYISKMTENLYNCINIRVGNNILYKSGNFNNSELLFSQATPEEKHWLNTCIKLDKFITFEEAMKTFIPEFVLPEKWFIKSTEKTYKDIYNFINSNYHFIRYDFLHWERRKEWNKANIESYVCFPGVSDRNYHQYNPKNYKEITFEQFKKYVLKEIEPVMLKTKIESKPFEILSIVNNITKEQLDLKKDGYFRSKYSSIHLNNVNDKYSIVSVANKEGNIFEIGDTIISTKSKRKTVQTIKSFKYSANKLKIQAVTTLHVKGINIERLEHFIEVEPEFVLPDTWYVVVNKENLDTLSKWMFKNSNFKLAIGGIVGKNNFQGCKNSKGWNETKIIKGKYYDFGNEITFEQFKKYVLKETKIVEPVVKETQGNGTIYYKGKWAEIIGYEPQVGDKFNKKDFSYPAYGRKFSNSIYTIVKFQGSYDNPNSVITFKGDNWIGDHTSTILLKNIKIIK